MHGLPLGWALTGGTKLTNETYLIESLHHNNLVFNTKASVTILGDMKPIYPRAFEAPGAGFTDKLAKLIVLRRVKNGTRSHASAVPSPDLAVCGGAAP